MHERPINPDKFDSIPRPEPVVASSVLGMGLFLFAEFMLFMGLISGFLIIKSNAVGQIWPPPGQPRHLEALAATSPVYQQEVLLFHQEK